MKTDVPSVNNMLAIFREVSLQEDSSDNETESESQENDINNDSFIEYDHILYSISSWLDKFKHIMPKTYLVDVPAEISKLLLEEDLPRMLDEHTSPTLDEFCEKLNNVIKRVGGTAFIKNNWHAPKDAAMFSLNYLLKVTCGHDAISYMSYSETFLKDFSRNLGNMPYCIAVRPWIDIHPASEFRCIVAHNEFVGITPREWPKYYAHYKEIMPDLIDTVNRMFNNHIKNKFPAENFVFDVIYTSPENCMLWDFNALNESTKLYAFIWDEIKNIMEGESKKRPPVFRFLEEDCGILPNHLSYHQEY